MEEAWSKQEMGGTLYALYGTGPGWDSIASFLGGAHGHSYNGPGELLQWETLNMQKVVLSALVVLAFVACNKNNSNPQPAPGQVYTDETQPGDILHCRTHDNGDRGPDRAPNGDHRDQNADGPQYVVDINADPSTAQQVPGPRGQVETVYSQAQMTITQIDPSAAPQQVLTAAVNVDISQDPHGQKSYNITAAQDIAANDSVTIQQGQPVFEVNNNDGQRYGTFEGPGLPDGDHRQPMDCR